MKLNTILISRTDSIGDVVLTLPICGLIKKISPETKIVFLGKKYTRPVIVLSKHVDLFLDWDEIKNQPPNKLLQQLPNQRLDAVFHVYPRRDIARYMFKAGIKLRVGTSHRPYNWFYCNHLVHFSRKKSNLHESVLNTRLVDPFYPVQNNDRSKLYQFTGIQAPEASAVVSQLIDTNRINIILHPKSKGSAREWPLSHYSELIRMLHQNGQFKILITGTEEEGKLLQGFLLENKNYVMDLTGQLSLVDFIALISLAEGLVACSTGPLHIASMLGKAALGIYPSLRPLHPGRWAPIGINAAVVEHKPEGCAYCKKKNSCACMENIAPQRVYGQLLQLLNKKPA